jgi:hypothetical protein
MIKFPKITKIDGGTAAMESDALPLGNYKNLGFLFENKDGAKLTVQVKASRDGGDAVPVGFLIKPIEATEFELVEADGKAISDAGAFLAVVNDRMLAHDEYDSVAVSLKTSGDDVGTVYAIQDAPRYSDMDNE